MLDKAITKGELPKERKDEFYQLFKYPVQAAAQMNNKLLYGQLARHGKEISCSSRDVSAEYWKKSEAAYDSIISLTKVYNEGYYNQGKWNRMMDFQPRRLPVFNRVPHTVATQPLAKDPEYIACLSANDCFSASPLYLWKGLGYEGKAISIVRNQEVGFVFDGKKVKGDSITIQVRWVPIHPMDDKLRFSLSLDAGNPVEGEVQTRGRSELWKVNTLQCQARVSFTLPVARMKKHRILIKALDEGLVLDQVCVY